jgi:hypothetical protein
MIQIIESYSWFKNLEKGPEIARHGNAHQGSIKDWFRE